MKEGIPDNGHAPSSGKGRVAAPKRLLVHICCGPCSVYPVKRLLDGASEVWGFFHNPNIHPFSEFQRRLDAVKRLAQLLDINVIYDDIYRPKGFFDAVRLMTPAGSKAPPREARCPICYSTRLEETARAAVRNGFDAFTTSLLYSTSQRHDEIRSIGFDLARKYGIIFYYEDFRRGWQAGIDESKSMGLYRQKWCGCIYSKIERYANKDVKKRHVAK